MISLAELFADDQGRYTRYKRSAEWLMTLETDEEWQRLRLAIREELGKIIEDRTQQFLRK